MGLVFGLPPAWGAHAMGVPWVPYGVAAITLGLVVGLLIAFTADALFPRTQTSTDQRSPVSERLGERTADTNRQRLAEEKTRLDRLAAERERRGNSDFGKTTEERIVWGELLELELQDIDEQVSRICDAAGGATGPCSQTSIEPDTLPRKGGPHERNH